MTSKVVLVGCFVRYSLAVLMNVSIFSVTLFKFTVTDHERCTVICDACSLYVKLTGEVWVYTCSYRCRLRCSYNSYSTILTLV